ncbi:MAG: GIY-YIG nuclease family protein [Bacteroidales bacterium]|nr:GIY-YIG nuclease family protein [Bacteroidales bacterium]MBN2821140.1 GIY-YIG nuclease family protein [Bacteroidales bacterium]
MERGGFIYIMTNKNNTVIYIGVTGDLKNRVYEHKSKVYSNSFTSRYNLNKLVYYETFLSIEETISREKQLKGGSRKKKIELINKLNSSWEDLFDEDMEY